ncbi:UNKNOWN [Stylonychia lemnae]|uniref:AMP-activated protein kinase glycogen-binding domain-containing protein n=1 Tax=Stylonychia lemnae TaxID=5949 RepID=A0A077ZVG2_STYLE|nr:UNKNOWN [Stylonychia lemnae]|eukprot:CDW73900.1 UNKNOWN [Stylonychia lemnae]
MSGDNIQAELLATIEVQSSQINQLSTKTQDAQQQYEILQQENQELKKLLAEIDEEMEDWSYDPMEEILAMQKEMVDIAFAYSDVFDIPEDTKVIIKGEFNNWQPELMKKLTKNVFAYKTKVLAGYKYRFQFFLNENEQPSLDRSQPVVPSFEEEGSESNYQCVIKRQINSQDGYSSYEQELLQKMPEFIHPEMKKMYLQKFNENQEQINQLISANTNVDFKLVDQLDTLNEEDQVKLAEVSLLRNQNLYKQLDLYKKNERLAKAAQESASAAQSTEQISKIDAEIKTLGEVISNVTRGRYVRSKFEDPPNYYIINTYSTYGQNEIGLSKIYDPNGILIIDAYNTYMNRIYSEDGLFFSQYQVLTRQEQAELVKDMLNESHILTLKYQIAEVDDEKTFLSLEANPAGLNVNEDYTYYLDYYKFPTTMSHNIFRDIRARFINIGAIHTYIRPQTIQIYTAEHSPNSVNILHIHLKDHNEKTQRLQAYYLRDDQTAQEFEVFQVDANGEIPTYKILIQNQKVISLLYNGEQCVEYLEFSEKRIAQGEFYEITRNNSHFISGENMICQIANVPRGLIVSLDQQCEVVQEQPQFNLHSFCREDTHFAQWQGFVDVNIKSLNLEQTLLKNDINLAFPICAFSGSSEQTQAQYLNLMNQQ